MTDTRVVFNITEGPVTKVKHIEFEGQHFVSGNRLKTQIHTSNGILGMGLFGNNYNAEMTKADELELKKYYQSFGYLDVQVTREIKWDSDLKYCTVVFHINEGQQYHVASVAIHGNTTVKEDELLRFVKLRPGDVYNEGVVGRDKQVIGYWYGYRGRDVSPEAKPFFPTDRPGEVQVVYDLQERPPAKVGEVKIIGNTVTKENVIRRQVPLQPGQDLTYPDIKLAEANLNRLGIFDSKPDQGLKPTVEVLDPYGPSEYKDVLVTVAEKPTGSLMFGVGANSSSGLTGNIVLNESNFDITRLPTSWDDLWSGRAFRGGGEEFRISAMPGTVYQQYSVNFREPFLFDTPYSLGTSAYYYQRIYNEYTESRVGGQIQLGRQLNRMWSANTTTRIEGVGVHSVPDGAPPDYENLAGNTYFLLGLGANMRRDARDSFLRPTEGSLLNFGFEEVLGAFTFPKADINFSKYFTMYQRADGSGRHVLATRSEVAWEGSNAPVYERYFAGGFQTIRGFQFRGVGPNVNGFMVGGNFMMLNSAEYQIPLRANDQMYFVSFIDTGTVEPSVELKDYRVSVGVGLRIVIPMMGPMPIALDLGFPINKTGSDREQVFNFWVGYFH
jgi:outer membrane protein assembly factor BamA